MKRLFREAKHQELVWGLGIAMIAFSVVFFYTVETLNYLTY
jgi:hypothetical protein